MYMLDDSFFTIYLIHSAYIYVCMYIYMYTYLYLYFIYSFIFITNNLSIFTEDSYSVYYFLQLLSYYTILSCNLFMYACVFVLVYVCMYMVRFVLRIYLIVVLAL